MGAAIGPIPKKIPAGTSCGCDRYHRSPAIAAPHWRAPAPPARHPLDSGFPRPVDPDVLVQTDALPALRGTAASPVGTARAGQRIGRAHGNAACAGGLRCADTDARGDDYQRLRCRRFRPGRSARWFFQPGAYRSFPGRWQSARPLESAGRKVRCRPGIRGPAAHPPGWQDRPEHLCFPESRRTGRQRGRLRLSGPSCNGPGATGRLRAAAPLAQRSGLCAHPAGQVVRIPGRRTSRAGNRRPRRGHGARFGRYRRRLLLRL